MNNNNFDQLNEMIISERGGVPARIKDNITQNRRIFGFMGDILDLFLPRLLQMLIVVLGGSSSSHNKRK